MDYNDYPAVEWTVYLKNIGTNATPILEGIQGLDTTLVARGGIGIRPQFVATRGTLCTEANQLRALIRSPAAHSIHGERVHHLFIFPMSTARAKGVGISESGKSCDGPKGWPYYDLQMPGGGIILAIGWPGQWASSFRRWHLTEPENQGRSATHPSLSETRRGNPRTPFIAMLFWQGTDVVRAQQNPMAALVRTADNRTARRRRAATARGRHRFCWFPAAVRR